MRGRPPVPTALKLVRGNPGKRALNDQEPEIPVADASIKPPEHLNEIARREWVRMAHTLVTSRVLTEGDLAVFEAYCVYYAEFVHYSLEMRDTKPYAIIRKLDKNGKEIPNAFYIEWHPARTMRDAAWNNYLKAAAQLGLTPSARSRVRKEIEDFGVHDRTSLRARLRS